MGRLVLGEGAVGQQGRVADDGGVRVGVAGADELGLETLQLLLVSKLVGLQMRVSEIVL